MDTRPDNTSAIIALQRAAATPMELTKQNLLDCVVDLGLIYREFMAEYYGTRYVEIVGPEGMGKVMVPFDFGMLRSIPCSIDLDAGASSYWSEIASMQTLDNLLLQGKIPTSEYLRRLPNGQLPEREALLAIVEAAERGQTMDAATTAIPGMGGAAPGAEAQAPLRGGMGYAAFQRAINQTGEVPK